MELQKATGYLKSAFYQGHGRYVNQIVRMTLKFCKNSGGSREMRRFIETRLVDTAKENPGCVIYVKPRLFKAPVISAEYLNGQKQHLSFYRMSSSEIEEWIKWFLTRSGNELYKLNRPTNSYRPTVQGLWTPFYFRDPQTNLTKFPSEELGRHISERPSATDLIKELAAKQHRPQPKQEYVEEQPKADSV